jgi:maleylpyruvate isomerase
VPATHRGRRWALDDTLAVPAARHVPVARIDAGDLDRSWTLSATCPTLTGPGHALLAWLSGRGGEPQLRSDLPLRAAPRWPLQPVPGGTDEMTAC